MRINDRSKTDFDRAKIKLTGHFDRRPTGRYFEPCNKRRTKHKRASTTAAYVSCDDAAITEYETIRLSLSTL